MEQNRPRRLLLPALSLALGFALAGRLQAESFTTLYNFSAARSYVLRGTRNAIANWAVKVLAGSADITAALTGVGGWTTPELAPGAYLDTQVSLAPKPKAEYRTTYGSRSRRGPTARAPTFWTWCGCTRRWCRSRSRSA